MTRKEREILEELIEKATKHRNIEGNIDYYRGVKDGLEVAIKLLADIDLETLPEDDKENDEDDA